MASPIDFEELARQAGDAMVVGDVAGTIIFWNAAAERMFGFTAEEALGRSLDLIVPERHRQRHWSGYHATLRTGVTRYGTELLRVPALHKDGRALSIAFTVALLQGGGATPTAILAVIRDETARWAEEKALRRRLAEAEAISSAC